MISQNSCEYANESTGKLTNHRPNGIDSLITPDNIPKEAVEISPLTDSIRPNSISSTHYHVQICKRVDWSHPLVTRSLSRPK